MTRKNSLSGALCGALIALAPACSSDEAPTAPPPEAPSTLDPVQAERTAARVLSPSPLELDKAVRKAGLAESLGQAVPDRSYDMAAADVHAAAVRTGVMLADAVFVGESASTEDLVERATAVRDGMQRIGATETLVAQVSEMIVRLRTGASTRGDILAEIDGITAMMVPEEGWGPDDRTGPLLQAGVWLEGAHLVATACLEKRDLGAADNLLRDRELVNYFLQYVQTQGTEHAPSPVVAKVEKVLLTVRDLSAKEHLTTADVEQIRDLTGAVIAML